MAIKDNIQEVKDSLTRIKRNRAFKKANAERDKAVELQASLAKCRGKLELSLKDFNRAIRQQVSNINEGNRSSTDIALQEQLLWDSALGYMLVKDAIYALKTVTTYDSIAYGYDLLEAAVDQMDRKSKKLPTYGSSLNKARNKYGYLTSETVKAEKVRILESIFEDLKKTGDIETCLAAAENKNGVEVDFGDGVGNIDKTDPRYLDSILGKDNGNVPIDDFNIDDI